MTDDRWTEVSPLHVAVGTRLVAVAPRVKWTAALVVHFVGSLRRAGYEIVETAALADREAKLVKAKEALKPFADDLCKRPWIASHLTWEVDKTNLTNRDLHRAATTLKDIA